MKMTGITEKQLNETKQKNQIVVVDFFASWCGPCQMFYGVFDKVQKELKDNPMITLVKVDVDEENNAAAEAEVATIPTIVAYKNGKEINRFSGFMSEQNFKTFLKNLK